MMRRRSVQRLVFLAGAALVLAACSGPAGPGPERLYPDPQFGSGGLALAADSGAVGGADVAEAVAVDERGALVAGWSCDRPDAACDSMDTAAVAWRFLKSGGLDGGFASGGTLMKNGVAGGKADVFLDVRAVPGGTLLVGSFQTAGNDMDGYLFAIDAEGRPLGDWFGGTGWASWDGAVAAGGHDFFAAAVPTSDGVWISGGATSAPTQTYELAIWKLKKDRSLDPSFNAGKAWVDGESSFDWAPGLALDGSGRPVAAGVRGRTAALWRLNPTGGLDTAFGASGMAALTVDGAGQTEAWSVLAEDGGYLVAGWAKTANGWRLAVWKRTLDGSPDPNFGQAGVLVLPEPSANGSSGKNWGAFKVGLAKDENGRYWIAGGVVSDDGDLDAAVWRVLASGVEDPNFCGGGPCTFDRAGKDDWATSLALEGNAVYLAGWASATDGDPDAALWRLLIGH